MLVFDRPLAWNPTHDPVQFRLFQATGGETMSQWLSVREFSERTGVGTGSIRIKCPGWKAKGLARKHFDSEQKRDVWQIDARAADQVRRASPIPPTSAA